MPVLNLSKQVLETNSQMFEYKELDKNSRQIRLIALQACADSTAEIDCKLILVDLATQPKYEAISYMWGSQTKLKAIRLDSKRHKVGHNLWLALHRFRSSTVERIIWIDAICINQDNTLEKNHQVNQMSEIYSQAAQVLVWLGPETEDSGQAMRMLRQLSTAPNDPEKYYLQEGWYHVHQLCEMEYWNRLWIIQEVVQAPHIKVYCGSDWLSWDVIEYVRGQIKNISNFRSEIFSETALGVLSQSRYDRYNGLTPVPSFMATSQTPIVELLLKFQTASCIDPRDLIYGLLSLCADCCKKAILVDYSKDTFQIYNLAFAHCADVHGQFWDDSAKTWAGYYSARAMMLRYRLHERSGGQFASETTSLSTIIYTGPLESVIKLKALTTFVRHDSKWFNMDHHGYVTAYIKPQHMRCRESRMEPSQLSSSEPYQPSTLLNKFRDLGTIPVAIYIHLLRTFAHQYEDIYVNRSQMRLFLDNDGRIGLIPKYVVAGDQILRHSQISGCGSIVRRNSLGDMATVVIGQNMPKSLKTNEFDREFHIGLEFVVKSEVSTGD